MIKAEVISEDNGYEVPNWLTKCKDVLTSPPTIGTVTVLLVAVFGFVIWQHHASRPPVSNETGVQSVPASGSQLQVIAPSQGLSGASAISASHPMQSSGSSATSAQSPKSTMPVGPAPASSLNSLQPTGSAQQSGNLTQALEQNVQSAGNATAGMLNGVGL